VLTSKIEEEFSRNSPKYFTSSKEEQIWVTREAKTKARRNNRKRPSILPRKNEN
jgi:hypothetical protein